MRLFLAALLTLVLIGGMGVYIQFARSVRRPPPIVQADMAEGVFEVELARTFNCVADKFAELKALEVSFRGNVIYSKEEDIDAETPLRFSIPGGVETGENEISVQANRDFLETGLAAIQVTLYRNDVPIRRQTITSEPEISTVSGSVVFVVKSKGQHDDHR